MNMLLEPGSIVAGRYRLDRLLGKGGMGQVWAVTHTVTQRVAALKFLNGPVHSRAERRRRFLREARAASAVHHPNVVRIHDFFELEDGTPVMLMDLLDGETLGQRLARESMLSVRDAADVLLPVVSALGTAHALGIIHRDLKPDNVFLAHTADGELDVRVLDFGIAKLNATAESALSDAGSSTDTGALLGTPYYMAPEQCFGGADVDHRADIWAVGVMLYEALTGVRPIDGENVGRVLQRLMTEAVTPVQVLDADLPPDLVDLVNSMLTRDPAARPADLRAVHVVLERYASIAAPPFDGAIRERPLVVDSNASNARASQPSNRPPVHDENPARAVIHVLPGADPDGATLVNDPPFARAVAISRGVDVRAESRTIRRSVWAVGVLLLFVGALAFGRSRARDGERPSVASPARPDARALPIATARAPVALPVPAARAARSALAPAAGTPPPAESARAARSALAPAAVTAAPVKRGPVAPSLREGRTKPQLASSASAEPSPSKWPPPGLVDEPPF